MAEVLLVRHAAAGGQQASDAPLTTEGERQAEVLSDLLAEQRVARVICSPFLRAIQTIAPYCQRAGLEVEVEPRLVERVLSPELVPDWRAQLRRTFDDLDHALPGGESSREAQRRAVVPLREALASEQRCVLVTHGNLLALLLKVVQPSIGYDDWQRMTNPDVYLVNEDAPGKAVVRRIWSQELLTQP
jgi:2,3-bisphosphoglycerate-dependent phosphoglycerate mutase